VVGLPPSVAEQPAGSNAAGKQPMAQPAVADAEEGKRRARGREIRGAIRMVVGCPQAVALLDEADDTQLEALCQAISGYSGLPVPVGTPDAPWEVFTYVPGLCINLQARIDRSSKTVSQMLEGCSEMPGNGRIMSVVAALPVVKQAMQGGSSSSAPGESGDALVRAAESLANIPAAKAGVQDLVRMAESGADDAALRAAARALETGAHGAEVALILHQENLDKPPSGASPSACTLLQHMRQIRRYLLAARARWLEPYLPAGLVAEDMVKAAMSGSITVGTLGVKASAKAEVAVRALMVVWPVLCALIRETTPRDPSWEDASLTMAKEAFDDASKNPSGALRIVMVDVFAERRKRSAQYLSGVEPELASWETVRSHVALESQRKWVLSGTYSASSQGADAAAKARADAAAKAKAEAEKEAAAAAAAAAGGTGGGGEEGSPHSPKAKKGGK
jgi:hypothetical protein